MIRADELMTGSYIYCPDCYDKVVEIRSNGIIGTDSSRGIIPFSQLEPIPITPEILVERNGFEQKDDDHFLWDKNFEKIVWFKDGMIWITSIRDGKAYKGYTGYCCYNVHELQQAMRLCGINKTIKL